MKRFPVLHRAIRLGAIGAAVAVACPGARAEGPPSGDSPIDARQAFDAAAQLQREGKLPEARAAFQALAADGTTSGKDNGDLRARARLNAAAIGIQQGGENLSAATADLGALESSDRLSPDLQGQTQYLLGLIEHAQAAALAESKPDEAIAGLKKAERRFRNAAALAPDLAGAAKNVDLTQRLIAAIEQAQREREQQKQQQGQQSKSRQQQSGDGQKQEGTQGDSQEQNGNQSSGSQKDRGGSSKGNQDSRQSGVQDQQQSGGDQATGESGQQQADAAKNGSRNAQDLDQLAKLAQEQRQAAEQSRGTPAEPKPSAQQQAEQQKDLSERTRKAAEQMRQRAQEAQSEHERQSLESAADKLDQANAAQHQAMQKMGEDASQVADAQQQAANDIAQAREIAQSATLGDEKPPEGETPQPQAAQGQPLKGQQGAPAGKAFSAAAAEILNKEQRERLLLERLRRLQSGRNPDVEKDW